MEKGVKTKLAFTYFVLVHLFLSHIESLFLCRILLGILSLDQSRKMCTFQVYITGSMAFWLLHSGPNAMLCSLAPLVPFI